MKNIISVFSFCLFVLLSCTSCDILEKDKNEPVIKLSSAGFEGTLPDNLSVKTGL